MNKPYKRSQVRLFFGKLYYILKKNAYWYLSCKHFARSQSKKILPYEISRHQSLLLRQLKDVEMWMQYNKIKNLELAIARLDGLVIKTGEFFSYWLLIGNPSKRKGFLPGMVLHEGQVKSGIGGGLCQLSNLIYWMTLFTPLTIIERWRHGYDVFPDANRTQPFGSGATCAYPNIDLQIKNETRHTFQLKLQLTKTHLIGIWYADKPADVKYDIDERNHRIVHEWWGGYTRHNEIFRISFDNKNNKISENLIASNQAIMMYDPLLKNSEK